MTRGRFEALYEGEFASVFRTAYLITGDRQEALDLAQEAFVRAYERWRSVRDLRNPAAWLQRVVANLALSAERRRHVTRRRAPRIASEAARSMHPSDPDLMEALRRLSPAQRTVIVLRYYTDQSIQQVADALGKRPGTITALASQGLARLRAELEERIVDEA
ncbi:MAG: sigma-70 family RNA polymerase sigma factor [Candidatus Velamenicoccus archaeovorus]